MGSGGGGGGGDGRAEWEAVWPLVSAVVAAAVLWMGSGCSLDIFDVEVDLQTQKLTADFGPPRGSIPDLACDPDAADPCADAAAIVGAAPAVSGVAGAAPYEVKLVMACDAGTTRCYAQADARLAFSAQALDGGDFGSKVARRATGFVRAVDVAYTVPTNTLTFDVPAVTVFVGPPGTRRETDPGVAAVDAMAPLTAGTPVTDARHLSIASGTPARAFIEQSVRSRRPFVFVLVVAPRLDAGRAIPAGALEIDLSPRLTLGLPR